MVKTAKKPAKGKAKAEKALNEMCAKLLANTVIENYRFELE